MSEVDDWIETLAGRGADGAEDAQALRRALHREQAGRAPGVPAEQDLRYVALLSRLEREGLLAPRRAARPRTRWLPISVAAMLVLAVGVGVLLDSQMHPALQPQVSDNFDSAPRFRGAPGAQRDTAHDARWLQRRLAEVRGFGLPYRLSRQDGQWLLEFYVATPTAPEVQAWLQREGITPQATGWVALRVAE